MYGKGRERRRERGERGVGKVGGRYGECAGNRGRLSMYVRVHAYVCVCTCVYIHVCSVCVCLSVYILMNSILPRQAALIMDGKVRAVSYSRMALDWRPHFQTLEHALDPLVQESFLNVTLVCKSVICCR